MSAPIVDIDRVTVRFGARDVLADIRAQLAPGEVVGLVGPNGAGKTTLLKALAGLVRPRSGAVSLEGQPVLALPAALRARRIGYLAQDRAVAWPMTVRRLAELGRLPHLAPWQRLAAADQAAVDRALAAADAFDIADRPVTAVSGGELARAQLARLLAGEPHVVLADEPIAELDPAHRLRTMELMAGLGRQGRAVVLTLHDLSLAHRFCTRVWLLDHGRLAADGPPPAVLTPAIIARVFATEMRLVEVDGATTLVPLRAL
ncbi:MAG: ABC transporter ATP-binding protein [Rhodospirillaceae bacterium]|nr:ABC transporter ATP-binding protein [Rhodospirillaceae bacterium]